MSHGSNDQGGLCIILYYSFCSNVSDLTVSLLELQNWKKMRDSAIGPRNLSNASRDGPERASRKERKCATVNGEKPRRQHLSIGKEGRSYRKEVMLNTNQKK